MQSSEKVGVSSICKSTELTAAVLFPASGFSQLHFVFSAWNVHVQSQSETESILIQECYFWNSVQVLNGCCISSDTILQVTVINTFSLQ